MANANLKKLHDAVTDGKLEQVKTILKYEPGLVNGKYGWNQSPLILTAASNGRLDVVDYLLTLPSIQVDAVNESGETALMHAAFYKRMEMVKLLCEKGNADIKAIDSSDSTVILYAMTSEDISEDIILYLLERGDININHTDDEGESALTKAIKLGLGEIVTKLLNYRIEPLDFSLTSSDGYTYLMVAISEDEEDIARLLLEMDTININATGSYDGQTALTLAVLSESKDLVEKILAKGADPSIETSDGYTAAAYARELELEDIIALFPEQKDDVETSHALSYFAEAAKGNAKQLKKIIDKDPDKNVINSRDFQNNTMLMKAAERGHGEVVDVLLAYDTIDVSAKNDADQTAMSLAAKNDENEILKKLLATKKDLINEVLLDAVSKNEEKIVRNYFTASKTNVFGKYKDIDFSYKGSEDMTALMIACEKGFIDLIKILNKAGFELDAVDYAGRTSLILAVQRSDIDMVKHLIEEYTPGQIGLDKRDNEGYTALMAAATIYTDHSIEEALLGIKRINKKGYAGLALTRAAYESDTEKVRQLLAEPDLDVNMKDDDGYTPLMLAIEDGNLENTNLILNYPKTKIDCINNNGQTAVSIALDMEYEDDPDDDVNVQITQTIFKQIHTKLLFVPNYKENVDKVISARILTQADRLSSIKNILALGGYDVSEIPFDEYELRQAIQSKILAAGCKADMIWHTILKGKESKVLPLLVLIAEDIGLNKNTDEDTDGDAEMHIDATSGLVVDEDKKKLIEEREKFWVFLSKDDIGRQYLMGLRVDKERNNIYHYCAKAKNESACINLINMVKKRGIPLKSVLKRKNTQGNTFLHEIFHEGEFAIFDKLRKDADLDSFLKNCLFMQNLEGDTYITAGIKSNTDDERLIHTMESCEELVSRSELIYGVVDRERNTLLHLSVTKSRYTLIPYLAEKNVNPKLQNRSGMNPIHVAVKLDNAKSLECLYQSFQHEVDINNDKTASRETALHIASKKGFTSMIRKLVDLGADLSATDIDGHTPLHDCLQQISFDGAVESPDKSQMFFDVWNTVVDVCAIWWCKKHGLTLPDKESKLYRLYRHEALFYLRSEIPNALGLSVLQYAAYLSLTECAQVMMAEKDIFVRQMVLHSHMAINSESGKPMYEIEVTGLMPEFISAINYTSDVHPSYYVGRKTMSQTLSELSPPVKASGILTNFPMNNLAKHEWSIYQWFLLFFMLIHLGVMIWYTVSSQSLIQDLNLNAGLSTLKVDSSILQEADYALVGYSLFIFLLMVPFIFIKIKLSFFGKLRRKIRYGDDSKYDEYVEDKGSFLSKLTVFCVMLAIHAAEILPVLFAALTVFNMTVALTEAVTVEKYMWIKSIVILVGWFVLLIPARAYSPIYNFMSAFKYIVIKDMVPFLLFFGVVSVAFGCAIQLNFQLLTAQKISAADDTTGLETFPVEPHKVIWELLILTSSMDTHLKHIQNVAELYEEEKYHTFIIEGLLVVYALIALIILMNMLIAMMGTTFSSVVQKQGTGWRQYQVKQAKRIRRITCSVLDRFVRLKTGATLDSSGRWFLPMRDKEIKAIRAKYWKTKGTKLPTSDGDSSIHKLAVPDHGTITNGNETTSSGLAEKLMQIENKQDAMEQMLKNIEGYLRNIQPSDKNSVSQEDNM